MNEQLLQNSLDVLAERFKHMNWKYPIIKKGAKAEKVLYWPGDDNESIMVCVLQNQDFREDFHRHDFFFFNYAYRGDYQAVCYTPQNLAVIHEGECYIGQPFSGYGLKFPPDCSSTVLGVLIRKEMFFKDFFPLMSTDDNLFHFFINSQHNELSEEFMNFTFDDDIPVKQLLEVMVAEYAFPKENTREVIKFLSGVLLMYISRQYSRKHPAAEGMSKTDKILSYISANPEKATLQSIAEKFSYHPNYVSELLHRKTGKTFSEILLRCRMERAAALLKNTTLTVEDIAYMLGYNNSSNFYKAFRAYYHKSPRKLKA